jgi:formylglycine-generating enzyme required for sulfatase activity
MHLVGNALEWVRDGFDVEKWVDDAGWPPVNPVGPDAVGDRIVRGGHSYSRTTAHCSLAYPDRIGPFNRRRGLGFRCAEHGPATAWVTLP